ncbi:uncharacterized protein LOC114279114 [Camellia sinensis]|uniref:uncharacterized protein LOC114279114 n=1 Tax=Camellia sinensis TaxID=4442 RepID=UPI0010360508|nr:uncharacterized protein LOC114279114 [Camellia sinensis]
MEALSQLLSRAVQVGLLEGFSVADRVGISHLLYADDALIFCGADSKQLGFLQCVLLCFEVVSGLKVNLAKSELIPVREVAHLPTLAVILGCKASHLLVSYLGLPLGASYKAKGVWDGVLERVQCQLARWKRQYLSKGERLTLVKSVLGSTPTYFMSVHVIPVSVARRLERLQHDFLLGNDGGGFQYHLANWKQWWPPSMGWEGASGVLGWWEALISVAYGRGFGWGGFNSGNGFSFGGGRGVFPWHGVWVSSVPSKVAFFVWTAVSGRILTIDNLVRRNHILVNWCCMCCADVKIVGHLLIHCLVVSRLWVLVFSMFGVAWVQPRQVMDVLRCWGVIELGSGGDGHGHWRFCV